MADPNQQPQLAVVSPSETLQPPLASSQAPVVPPLAGPAPVAFWCYSCRSEVSLMPAVETICPTCGSGFLEEMSTADVVGTLRQQRRRVHSNPSRRFRLGLGGGLPTPRLVRILELLHAGDVLSGEAAPASDGAATTAEGSPAAEVRLATPVPDVPDVPEVPNVPAVRRPRERTRRRELGVPGFTDVTVQVVHRWDQEGSRERQREEQAIGAVERGSMAAEEINHGSRQAEDQGGAAPEPLLQPSSVNGVEDVGRTATEMEGIDIAVGVPARISANGGIVNSDDEDEEMEDLEGFDGMDQMDADDDEGWDEYSYSNFQIAGTMDGDDDDDDDEDDDEDEDEDDDEDEDVEYGQDTENENERMGAGNGTREHGVAGLTNWLLGEENTQRQQVDENNSTPLRPLGPSGVMGGERAREEAQTPPGTAEPQRRHRRRRTSQMREHVAVYVQSLLERNIEFHFQLPAFIGNPGDYLDSRGYEQLLNELAENDNSRRGAPPASKTVVDSLPTVLITEKQVQQGLAQCAVCKDDVEVGESATQLPCLHTYHSDCIVPWLSSRNSCPICRFELKTDDADYEEQRSRRRGMTDGQGRGWGLSGNEQVSQVAAAGSGHQDEPDLAQRNSDSCI
ncbi:hypothetical protein CBR_g49311 [Chara braunii]|uniref:RING-type E3 ubiquitin transferase n=1 Tax=Chara braunii TaxID=69332 RepID=A0A388M4P3_CHABU|nr:hypothetical protein CBR_g49311 [Chara braunii]|eukprot:GBG89521.1 hypothetical protein CBR_g49311 [Chara braunii]